VIKLSLLQLGNVSSTRPGPDDDKTLASLKFQTGDYIDIAVNVPKFH
jgi:hypothetical protein